MFNKKLKDEALAIHEKHLNQYNASYDVMAKACSNLYQVRNDAILTIQTSEKVINSIANTPKEFETKFGEVKLELEKFSTTEERAKDAYNAAVKAGVNLAGGIGVGFGVASMAPTALMSIATTFGTATTGTAISALSGAAAQKAALAWLGRTFAGFAVKGTASMAVGQTILALAGPIGWGITAVSTGASLISLSKKNKELADQAIDEAKEIAKAREALNEATEKIDDLKARTNLIKKGLDDQKARLIALTDADYEQLGQAEREFLGATVNNTLSLASLLNETIG